MAKRSHSRPSTKKAPAGNPDVRLFRLPGLPEIQGGDDLSEQITDAARKTRLRFEYGDVLVVAQKIVSNAEGAFVNLETIVPSPEAHGIADLQRKVARVVK